MHSLLLTLGGRSSCGCFGKLTVPPVVTLLFDLVVAALLLRCRPGWCGWPEPTLARRASVRAAGMAVLLLIGTIGWSYARYGSMGVAVAALRGDLVAVAPGSLRVGVIPAGETVERTLRVVNLSDEPLQVAMAEAKCNCAQVGGLPATVAPGASVDLPVSVWVGRRAGEFRRSARLRTSVGVVNFTVAGWVTAARAESVPPSGLKTEDAR